MKLIIAGSRDFDDYNLLCNTLDYFSLTPTEVVCGKARGADALGEQWAIENNIPVTYFPADWENLGKRAGYVRNSEMGKYGDCLIAFWDQKSRGTKHMIDIMEKLGKPYAVIGYDEQLIKRELGENYENYL